MKIAIITDTHFGARNDNSKILAHQERFFRETFIPYLDKHNIRTVIHGGDTYDKRRSISSIVLKKAREFLFEPMKERGIDYHTIIGNHDCFFKTTNDINFPELLDGEYGSVIYKEPVVKTFGSLKIGLVPWIAKDNYEVSMEFLNNTDASFIIGHFDIQGFKMYKGSVSQHGFKPSQFSRFDMVMSGHYHHKNSDANIHYLGSPYQMNWADYGDERGFHVLDTETRELEFVKNPNSLYHVINYDDAGMDIEDIEDIDVSAYEGSFVKVVVSNKTNPVILEALASKLDKSDVADLKVDEVTAAVNSDVDITEIEDMVELLDTYVDELEADNKDEVKNYMRELYRKASNT